MGYGDDPWIWFGDWDLEAGDMEEPLPSSDEFNIGFVRQHPPNLPGWHLPYPLLTLERGFKYEEEDDWWSKILHNHY